MFKAAACILGPAGANVGGPATTCKPNAYEQQLL